LILNDFHPQPFRKKTDHFGIPLSNPEQICLIFCPFAQTPLWIGPGADLSFNKVRQRGDLRLDSQHVFCHGTVQKRLVRGVSRNLKTQVATGFAEIQRKRISLNCISESQQSLREMLDVAQRDYDISIRRKYWVDISIDRESAVQFRG
jgi:hypothetical protein